MSDSTKIHSVNSFVRMMYAYSIPTDDAVWIRTAEERERSKGYADS